jgi:mono/diheme cytochrome c family protein
MRYKVPALTLFLIATISACAEKAPEQPYLPRSNFLSSGDPIAGKRTFLELKCQACHRVAGDDFDLQVQGTAGPQLGSAQAAQSADAVASSIAAPGHTISREPGAWQRPDGPGMKDYSRVMTVRQLIDLISYIRSLPSDGEDNGW